MQKNKVIVSIIRRCNDIFSKMDCSICLELISNPTHLSCGHSFHETCVNTWLSEKGTCPNCRHQEREETKTDSQYPPTFEEMAELWGQYSVYRHLANQVSNPIIGSIYKHLAINEANPIIANSDVTATEITNIQELDSYYEYTIGNNTFTTPNKQDIQLIRNRTGLPLADCILAYIRSARRCAEYRSRSRYLTQ
jgi:hypothetical protein